MVAGEVSGHQSGVNPLISVDKVTDLVYSTASLSLNMFKFTSDKIEESLTGEPKNIYRKFTNHCAEYIDMIVNMWNTSPAIAPVRNVVGIVTGHVINQYQRISKLSGKIIDPIVQQFEERYPASKGLIGSSILDRFLLIGWVYWMWKMVACLSAWAMGCRCCSYKSRK
jgi:hypothetical protein